MSNNRNTQAVPAVIIVGAGLGGLMLAILLEQIDIPYHIFERAAEVRPLGSAMALGPNILSVFEQLGLWEMLKAISLPCHAMELYDVNMKAIGEMNLRAHKALSGFEHLVFPRPELYNLMRKQVPDANISMNKKVLRTEEKEGKVYIHCSDGTTYEGDILVGADGAYSGVRQSLYKQLSEKGLLPKDDLAHFSIGYVNMVGIAEPKDPAKYPQLKDDFCHFSTVLGEGGRNRTAISVPNNKICWALTIQLSDAEGKEQHFRNSEWGPEANEAMIKEFQDLPSPWGGTMGEIIDATPRERISKVFLEEKVFKTWQHGQTVLLGDAAHKMTISAGQGAVSAMQDAVELANCFYNMTDARLSSVRTALEDYYQQRYPRALEQFERSKVAGKIMMGQTWTERLIRNVMLNYIPDQIHEKRSIKNFSYRPQVAWLPLAENRGAGHVLPQDGKRPDTTDHVQEV